MTTAVSALAIPVRILFGKTRLPTRFNGTPKLIRILRGESAKGFPFLPHPANRIETHGGKNRNLVKISVIVPAYNEEKLLPATLPRINAAREAFSAFGWESELIVCDNNSSDRTGEIAAEHGAMVAFEPVNQISRSRNRGASVASGDWLIFVDADSFPSKELFEATARLIQSGKCIGGGAIIRMDDFHFFAHLLVVLWNWLSRMRKWAAGSYIFCEAKAFRELGGFSTELYASEEIELSRRLNLLAKRHGKKVRIISDAPMLTSARKMRLYSLREYGRFIWKAAFRPREILGSRAECHPWYDGRR
jgi:glycosyltransferase involved in cell wall biosynthesis